ncbi:aspartate/glutamate racemase family protein [Raoultibacter phocaeensis]|uniref:aspartate/glutamate racemase family protein n=1 Tax=Raoultibacter phocaeensis TaxID=2479841 RepID=UPI0011182771|nr:amino acid racemase [Raoultibacter phocaeensis]
MEKLGIIGGLGPAATAQLFSRIVQYTEADRDQDHLDVTILNRPAIPDRTAFLLGKPGAATFVEPMQQAARELEELGCTVLATPCNTAHARLDAIASVLDVARFVDMPRSAAAFAARIGCKRVGVLATDGALAAGVFQTALAKAGLQTVIPAREVQAEVMSIIYDYVKAGRNVPPETVASVCEALVREGCDGIMLGCTELSLLGLGGRAQGALVIDALDVLAYTCVTECGAKAVDLEGAYRMRGAGEDEPPNGGSLGDGLACGGSDGDPPDGQTPSGGSSDNNETTE